jgi:hypothetical protein
MMVVAELEEPFLPLPDDLLVNATESRWAGSDTCMVCSCRLTSSDKPAYER